ncbi:NAD-binding protein [Sinorhizobium meliloti]|uniref:NAD(P)-dependent oxidoreductase n=1 Tax=Rhizobium meliloti TaxID=382 RepID=UPI001297870B|nr:NAD(P)-dependent oxidoreductase [Sinorhizobium meliloti]MDW9610876.1 NAD-binding protein [Sinorhizobium meliloti]MDW9835932.1 NAD-binding protein [Sinorhizobium meliloti]MDX0040379.1 NAD-binding protein [Sinorhizobium meliloti]MDX0088901.1 NAD-binding protein [Sinorhizobium meliloti]MQX63441.1 NAD-binding protein [Sinorhizobium meliloti]
MATERIGFIGLGSMGGAIAERFVEAGVPLVVCDRNPANLERFRAMGVKSVPTPREVADLSDIVLSCLPSPEASLEVALGDEGIVHGTGVAVYIETSTIGIKAASAIAEGLAPKIGFVDAPVSGGPPGARAGTLSTMASGARDHFERAREALSVMAKNVFFIGEKPGSAQTAKLINNHLSTAGRLAAFEGLVMAIKAGLDLPTLVEVINKSSGRNYTTTDKIHSAILSGTFKFNGQLSISIKDEGLLLDEARDLGVPLWVAPRLLETLQEAAGSGYLEKDSMWLIQYMGEQAGIDVKELMTKGS